MDFPTKLIFENRGKLTAVFDAPWTLAEKRRAGASVAGLENIAPAQSVFENISALLAQTGTPWETARECILRELQFWFPEKSPEFSAAETDSLPRAELAALALAQALAAKTKNAPLAVPAQILTPELLEKLRARAVAEDFPVLLECEKFAQAYALSADFAAVFYWEKSTGAWDFQAGTPDEIAQAPKTLAVAQKVYGTAENCFAGTLVNAGAGEFFAKSGELEFHGKLCGNASDEIPENAEISIFLPPQIFRISEMPQDECSFELKNGGEITFDGHFFRREFFIGETSQKICIAAQHRQSLETLDDWASYAWFFPEDALGFLA